MDEHTSHELAYKKGYEDGKRDAVKRGRWIEVDDGVLIGQGKHHECSRCGTWTTPWRMSNYCPYCGCDMRGEEDGN